MLCQELPTISPQRGVWEEVKDNLPLSLWCMFLCNGFAYLRLSFAFCLSACRFLTALVLFLLVTLFLSKGYFLASAKVKDNCVGPQISN